MTTDELRRWVAKRLKPQTKSADWRIDNLFDAVRRVDETYLAGALNGTDRDRKDFLAEAQRHWETIVQARKGPPKGERTVKVDQLEPSEPGQAGHFEKDILGLTATRRMEAFVLGLGRLMAREEPVKRLRTEFLGRTLTRAEAEAFCRSPAVRLCTREEFAEWSVPLIEHDARLLDEEVDQDGVPRTWRFVVEPPGYIVTGGSIRGLQRIEPTFIRIERDEPDLFVRPDSVLDEILNLAVWLADRYAVDPMHAMHLILTDELPPIPPIRPDPPPRELWSKDPSSPWGRFELSLVIDPWLPEPALLRLYRDARREMLGRKSRSVSSRALEVFCFCMARIEDKPDWRYLLTEWDKAHAGSAFGPNGLDKFRATFKRAYRVVMGRPFDGFTRRASRAEGPANARAADRSVGSG